MYWVYLKKFQCTSVHCLMISLCFDVFNWLMIVLQVSIVCILGWFLPIYPLWKLRKVSKKLMNSIIKQGQGFFPFFTLGNLVPAKIGKSFVSLPKASIMLDCNNLLICNCTYKETWSFNVLHRKLYGIYYSI